jgi:predicted glycoside hydrolase/deacetylase ChbG (UPF0249 family)
VKRLIVNADDFGITQGANRAIVESYRHGIVTSTTLMATGKELDHALALARENPGLSVGCHVTLLQDRPLLDASQVPTLATVPSPEGPQLRAGFAQFAMAALTGRLHPDEIAAESEAQIRRLQASGIRVSHLDTHKHAHTLPPVLCPLLEAARRCGVPAIRNPFELHRSFSLWDFLREPRIRRRYAAVGLLRRFAAEFRRLTAQFGILTTDGAFGVVATGCLDERRLRYILGQVPKGTWELVCHPAYLDQDLLARSSLRTGEGERAALTSGRIRDCIREYGIELTTFEALLP